MLAKVFSGTPIGLDGVLIEVEVDVANRGLPLLTIVGLPDKAIGEAKERVKTAIVNSFFEMPDSRITVNLAPADIPKEGSLFDLPIAVGILAASGTIDKQALKNNLFVGELSLEGEIKGVSGVLPVALMAGQKKIANIFVPEKNVFEACMVEKLTVYAAKTLADLISHLNGQKTISPSVSQFDEEVETVDDYEFDFAEVKGQELAKRALEIAAAGGHNVHLTGPPGAGKTMLSRAFPSILPVMDKEERLDVSKIYSIAGLINGQGFAISRPFRKPHHTISRIGLVGGGTNPAPGEISLAHRGVLFLDEFSEFPRSVLEALRQPLEDGVITISRAAGSLTFPAKFLLIAASNPCPCGYLGHPKKVCHCLPGTILRYRKKLSGPLLDRIDLHVDVPPVEDDKLMNEDESEPSRRVRNRVIEARERQHKRFKNSSVKTNGEMKSREIKAFCHLSDGALDLLKQAISRLALSARSYMRIIKLGQTIADLEKQEIIESAHIAEALQYRAKED